MSSFEQRKDRRVMPWIIGGIGLAIALGTVLGVISGVIDWEPQTVRAVAGLGVVVYGIGGLLIWYQFYNHR